MPGLHWAMRKLGVKAPLPGNEQERLAALHASAILDTAPEHSYASPIFDAFGLMSCSRERQKRRLDSASEAFAHKHQRV